MRILIIGGTGTISTGITRLLVEQGHDLVLYNRGQRPRQVEGDYEVVIGDRKDVSTFEKQMQEAGTFDCVIDMYCFLPEEAKDAIRIFSGRAGQYIYCSSVDAYTKPSATYPITESVERNPPETFPYGRNKMLCENLLLDADERGDLRATLIRPGHTYGEGGNNLLHALGSGNFILDRLAKGQPIVVHGDGTSFWPTCHRDDVAVAFVGAIGNEKAMGRGYHVAGEEWNTWLAYHEGLAGAIGAPSPQFVCIPTHVLMQMAPDEARRVEQNFSHNNLYDNTAAREDLGFEVTIPWVEGARRTAQWLDDNGMREKSEDFPFYDRVVEQWGRVVAQVTGSGN